MTTLQLFMDFVHDFPGWSLVNWGVNNDLYQLAYRQFNQSQTNFNPDTEIQGYGDPPNQTVFINPGPYAPFYLHAVTSASYNAGVLVFSLPEGIFTCDGAGGTIKVSKYATI